MPQHNWIRSTLGHGETMCSKCHVTNREAAVIGTLNECEVPDAAPPPTEMPPWKATHVHFKGGLYRFLAVGINTETNQRVVIYDNAKGEVFVRPETMFNGEVNGKPRFARLENLGACHGNH